MLRYRYVFRVEMLRYRFLFRVEIVLTTVLTAMKEYRQACSTGTVRIAPAECFNETKVPWLTWENLLSSRRRTKRPGRIYIYMGGSINGGTPKWLVYSGKSSLNGWELGVPLFSGNLQIYNGYCSSSHFSQSDVSIAMFYFNWRTIINPLVDIYIPIVKL